MTCSVCGRSFASRQALSTHRVRSVACRAADDGAEVAFWARVDRSGDCWLWTGALSGAGYGQLRSGGKTAYAHRYAYELLVGQVPEGLQLDHLCQNRACCNPAHLEPVTQEENIRRGSAPSAVVSRTGICARGHDKVSNRMPDGHCRLCKNETARARYAAR